MQYRNLSNVGLEVIVIGIMTVLLYNLLDYLSPSMNHSLKLFLVGALIHALFEYSGMNEKWCRDTYK
jgi:hypothetical protein